MIEHTYFGWTQLSHTESCATPTWDIDVRHDTGIRPHADRAVTHGCPDQHCTHDSDFGRVTVRVICRGCDTAHVITGESLARTVTTTDALGYGQAPRQIAGLYLWPGRPVLHGWGPGASGLDDQPHEYLVTTALVDRLTPGDCVGAIGRHRTAGGHPAGGPEPYRSRRPCVSCPSPASTASPGPTAPATTPTPRRPPPGSRTPSTPPSRSPWW